MLYVLEFQRECKVILEDLTVYCQKMLYLQSVTDINESICFLMHLIKLGLPNSNHILSRVISLYGITDSKGIKDSIEAYFRQIFLKETNTDNRKEAQIDSAKSLIKISSILDSVDPKSIKELVIF